MRPVDTHRRGQTTILFVLAIVPLLGMAGLAIDVGRMYTERRRAQAAADLAVSAGAQEVSRSGAHATFQDVAGTYATRNGFATANGDTITLNNPPTSGPYAGNPNAYEVVLKRPVPTTLLRTFGKNTSTVQGRAVAVIQKSGIGIVVLEPSKKEAFKMNKQARITLTSGSIYVNSNDHEAVKIQDSSSLQTPGPAQVVGGFKVDSNASLTPAPTTGVSPIPDPLASLPVPPCSLPVRRGTAASPSKLEIKNKSTTTICPGIYHGGVKVEDQSTVILDNCGLPPEQSVFVFTKDGFHLHGGTMIGNKVMIYNAPEKWCLETKTNCGNLHWDSKSSVTLTPPTGGSYEGIAIFQHRTCDKEFNLSGKLLGGIEGEFYLANARLIVNGGGKTAYPLKASFVLRRMAVGNYVATEPDDGLDDGESDGEWSFNAKTGASGRRVVLFE